MDRNVLFLCTGNAARSQMGEALLRRHAGGRFCAYSAGTDPKSEVFPPVVAVMREVGIDVSGQQPKGTRELPGRVYFEKVVIVCAEAERNCPTVFGAAQRLVWPTDDPAAATGSEDEVLAFTRRVRDELDRRLCDWLNEQGVAATPLNPEHDTD